MLSLDPPEEGCPNHAPIRTCERGPGDSFVRGAVGMRGRDARAAPCRSMRRPHWPGAPADTQKGQLSSSTGEEWGEKEGILDFKEGKHAVLVHNRWDKMR